MRPAPVDHYQTVPAGAQPFRLREPIGYASPAEFEEMYYREQTLVEDEGLKQLSLH